MLEIQTRTGSTTFLAGFVQIMFLFQLQLHCFTVYKTALLRCDSQKILTAAFLLSSYTCTTFAITNSFKI